MEVAVARARLQLRLAVPERVRPWATGPLIPMLVAVALGLFEIGAKSAWLDEAFSVQLSRQPVGDIVSILAHGELNAAPYYFALKAWMHVFGHSEAAVRSLSVAFGAMAVLATWAVANRWRVGFAAALILAVSPFFVEFEQEARTYTLLVAWSALASLAFLRLLDRQDRWRALAYGVLAGSLIYVHVLGALVVVAHGLWWLLAWWRGARTGTRLILATFIATAVAWLPMLVFAAHHRNRLAWIQPLTLDQLAQDLVRLGGGPIVVGAVVVLLVAGLRRDLLALWLATPIVGTLLISLLVQPALQAKYVITVLPAGAIIAARNRTLLVAALLVLSLVGVGDWYANGVKDDWRDGVAWVAGQARPSDGVLFAPAYLGVPFGYYGHVGQPVYPAMHWGIDLAFTAAAAKPPNAEVITRHDRIWLVTSVGTAEPAGLTTILSAYRPETSRQFGVGGPVMTLLVRSASP